MFAIEAFHEINSLTYSDNGLLQYLYGVKFKHKRNKQGKLIIEYGNIDEHRLGEKVIPSNFFAQPDTEYISAIIFSNSGTWPKFSRMGYQSGYHRGNIQMVRNGTCWNDDPNSTEPKLFEYDLDNPTISETWEEGLVVMHNPNALFPLPHNFIKCSTVHFVENDKVKTESRAFHPFGSMTLNGLREDVQQANITNLKPNFVNLLKYEFENFNFAHKPGYDTISEEKEWFSDTDKNLLGVVFRDKIDDDYGYLVFAKDKNNIFSTIDLEVEIPDRNDARTKLFNAMEEKLKI